LKKDTQNRITGKQKIILVFALLLCFAFITLPVMHHEHEDDGGSGCEACAIIETLIRLIGRTAGGAAFMLLCLLIMAALFSEAYPLAERKSPVELKIRMNN